MIKIKNVPDKKLAELKLMESESLIQCIENKDLSLGERYAIADLLKARFEDANQYDKSALVAIADVSNSSDLQEAVMDVLQKRGKANETETENRLVESFITRMMHHSSSSVSHSAKNLSSSRMQ